MERPRRFTLMWVDGVDDTPQMEQFETKPEPSGRIVYPDRAQSLMKEHGAQLSWDEEKEWYE